MVGTGHGDCNELEVDDGKIHHQRMQNSCMEQDTVAHIRFHEMVLGRIHKILRFAHVVVVADVLRVEPLQLLAVPGREHGKHFDLDRNDRQPCLHFLYLQVQLQHLRVNQDCPRPVAYHLPPAFHLILDRWEKKKQQGHRKLQEKSCYLPLPRLPTPLALLRWVFVTLPLTFLLPNEIIDPVSIPR